MIAERADCYATVHCRIGSSENDPTAITPEPWRSLPHRQLRNAGQRGTGNAWRSLPHRQLRKYRCRLLRPPERSLPHRQLRKPAEVAFLWRTMFTAA